MVTVQIRVSPFSRKILLTEFGGAEPVRPAKADWLADVLHIDRRHTNFRQRYFDALTTTIHIDLVDAAAERLRYQGNRLGVVLHRLHIEQLSRHMVAAKLIGSEAKEAMLIFYQHYGLDDDDFSMDSAYREYQRFQRTFFREKHTKSAKKSAPVVLRFSRILQGEHVASERPTIGYLNALSEYLEQELSRQPYRSRLRMLQQAVCYIYCVRGSMKPTEVARRTKRHLANVYKAIRATRRRMKKDVAFARLVREICSESFVLPAPAAAGHLCHIDATDARQPIPEYSTAITAKPQNAFQPATLAPGAPGFDEQV